MLSLQNRNTVNSVVSGGLTLESIFNTYSGRNMYTTSNLLIDGTNTTWLDYAEQHNLLNPAAANQATFSSSNANFNNNPTLSYDGTSDYNYKAVANYGSGQNSGVVAIVFRTPSSFTDTRPIFTACDEATNDDKFMVHVDNVGMCKMLVFASAVLDQVEFNGALSVDTTYVALWKSNGAIWTGWLDAISQTIDVTNGGNNGDWFGDCSGLDNLVIGARINTSLKYYDDDIAFVGCFPELSDADCVNLSNDLLTIYKPS